MRENFRLDLLCICYGDRVEDVLWGDEILVGLWLRRTKASDQKAISNVPNSSFGNNRAIDPR